jgi:hypothetical protein
MEVAAMETGKLDLGVYTQAVNALSGLLTKLGLDRRAPATETLNAYIKQRRGVRA